MRGAAVKALIASAQEFGIEGAATDITLQPTIAKFRTAADSDVAAAQTTTHA